MQKGIVKLSDFGLTSSPFAAAGVGTPLYSAPEALQAACAVQMHIALLLL